MIDPLSVAFEVLHKIQKGRIGNTSGKSFKVHFFKFGGIRWPLF